MSEGSAEFSPETNGSEDNKNADALLSRVTEMSGENPDRKIMMVGEVGARDETGKVKFDKGVVLTWDKGKGDVVFFGTPGNLEELNTISQLHVRNLQAPHTVTAASPTAQEYITIRWNGNGVDQKTKKSNVRVSRQTLPRPPANKNHLMSALRDAKPEMFEYRPL